MKIVFMGTPDFALPILKKVVKSYQVIAVFCQPDKKKGRRGKVVSPPVKKLALQRNIPVYQPFRLSSPDIEKELRELKPDLIIVTAYGKILPTSILEIPRYGCLNVHASLLPRHRGASPIQWALWQGDEKTGVSIMLMDEGMDTGPILCQEAVDIKKDDDFYALRDKLAQKGKELLIQSIKPWTEGSITPRLQDDKMATYTPLLTKKMGKVDWQWGSQELLNHLRAFCDWPKSYTFFRGKKVVLEEMADFSTYCPPSSEKPGQIVEVLKKKGIVVRTGDGVLLIKRLAVENKRSMEASDFINGYQPAVGEMLGNP